MDQALILPAGGGPGFNSSRGCYRARLLHPAGGTDTVVQEQGGCTRVVYPGGMYRALVVPPVLHPGYTAGPPCRSGCHRCTDRCGKKPPVKEKPGEAWVAWVASTTLPRVVTLLRGFLPGLLRAREDKRVVNWIATG